MLKVKKLLQKILQQFAVNQSLTLQTGVEAYKRGNVVTVNVFGVNTTSTTERTRLGTLPEGWRPPNGLFAANVSDKGYIDVQPDGKIEAFRPTSAGRVDSSITYAVKWGGYCIRAFSRLSAVLERWWPYAKPQENATENLAVAHRSAKADDALSSSYKRQKKHVDVHGTSRRNLISLVRVIRENLRQRNMEQRQFAGHLNSSACEYTGVDDELSNTGEKRRHNNSWKSVRQVLPICPNGIRCLQVPRVVVERGCFEC